MAQQTDRARRPALTPAPAPAPGAAVPGSRARLAGRRTSPRTLVIAAVAWLLAALFLLPYLEMAVTALRPADELRDPGYLPPTSPGPTSSTSGATPPSAATCA